MYNFCGDTFFTFHKIIFNNKTNVKKQTIIQKKNLASTQTFVS